MAFASGATSGAYAAEVICQRGIDFLPDISFRDSLRKNGISPEISSAIPSVRQLPAVQPPDNRVTALTELDAALALKRGRDVSGANDAFARAVKLAPDSASLHMAYANSLAAGRRPDEAEKEARRSIEQWPEDAEAHAALALALSLQNLDSQAVPEAREALRIAPNHKMATILLGLSLARSDQFKDAVPALRAALPYANQVPGVQKQLGAVLVHTGDFDGGIEQLIEFLKTNPNDADSHFLLGVALRGQHKNDMAAAQFKEAARLNPAQRVYAALASPGGPAVTSSANAATIGPKPNDGFTSQNVYTNNFFGFSFTFPKRWLLQSPQTANALASFGAAAVANGDPVLEALRDVVNDNRYSLLLVTRETPKEILPGADSIQIQALTAHLFSSGASDGAMAKAALGTLSNSGLTMTAIAPPTKVEIAGKTFWKSKKQFVVRGQMAYNIAFAIVEKEYVLIFSFSSPEAASIDDIAGAMQTLQFNTPAAQK